MSGKLIVFFMIFALAQAATPGLDIFKNMLSGMSSLSENSENDKTDANTFDPKNVITVILRLFNRFSLLLSNSGETTPDTSGNSTDESKDNLTRGLALLKKLLVRILRNDEIIPDVTNPEGLSEIDEGNHEDEVSGKAL